MAQLSNIPKRGSRGKLQSFRVLSPNKGLNNLVVDTDVDELESPDLLNVEFTERGNPGTRKGYVEYATEDDNPTFGLGEYYQADGDKFLIRNAGTSLQRLSSGAWLDITGKIFTASTNVNYTVARNNLYTHNGVDSMGKFDGTTLSTPATGIPLNFTVYSGGFQWGIGNPTYPSRLYRTAINVGVPDPDDFTGTNAEWVDVEVDDGDKLKAIAVWGDYLILFKERAVYQVSVDGDGVPTIKLIVRGVGCVSAQSTCNVDNDLFYFSRKGVYVIGSEPNYYNQIRSNELSARVRKTISGINAANFDKIAISYFDFKILIAIPYSGATANTHILCYDKKYLSWSLWDNFPVANFTRYIDSSNDEILLFGSNTSGEVYQMFSGYDDNGTAINSYWCSKRYNLKLFDEYKRWFDSSFLFRTVTGKISISIILDGYIIAEVVSIGSQITSISGIGVEVVGKVEIGTDGTTVSLAAESLTDVVKRLKVNKASRSFQIKVETNGVNDRFVLTGYNVTYYAYGHFKFPSADKL